MLIDTGLPTSQLDFREKLVVHVEPADLRWIYLTHPDRAHTRSLIQIREGAPAALRWICLTAPAPVPPGSPMHLLGAAPSARLIPTLLRPGILTLKYEIGPHRVFLLHPGQSLALGDRRLTAFGPRSTTAPR